MNRWFVLATATVLHRAPAQAPNVDVALVPEFLSVQPGTTFRVGLRLRIPDGWHLYWTNPGQSGLPTTLVWRVPAQIEHDTTLWPVPQREDSAGIVSHTYRGEVALVSSFRVSSIALPGAAHLTASLTWGICREICIPQRRDARLPISITNLSPQMSPIWDRFYATLAPQLPTASENYEVRAVANRGGLQLLLRRRDDVPTVIRRATFFPEQAGRAAGVLRPRTVRGVAEVEFPDHADQDLKTPRLRGLLVLEPGGALWLDVVVEHTGR